MKIDTAQSKSVPVKQARPKRQKLDDRFTGKPSTKEEIQIDYALAPFDRAATEYDLKWGVDRLPEIVSPEMAAKYGLAVALLNEAIDGQDPSLVVARANNCIKGLAAMDAQATQMGKQPLPPEAFEVEVDGVLSAIMPDASQWPAYQKLRPGVRVYSLREVGLALGVYGKRVTDVKDAFPKAEVTSVKPKSAEQNLQEDEIPW